MVQTSVGALGGPIAPGISIGGPGFGRQDSILLGGKTAKAVAIQVDNDPALVEGQSVTVSIQGKDGKMYESTVAVPANPDPNKVRDLLIAAINANEDVSNRVEAYHLGNSGELFVEGRLTGDDFNLLVSATVFDNYTSIIQSMPSDGPKYHFGTVICHTADGKGGESLNDNNQNRIAGILLKELIEVKPGQKVAHYEAGDVGVRKTEGPVNVRVTPGVEPQIGDNVYARYRINPGGPAGQVIDELTNIDEPGFTHNVSDRFAWMAGTSGHWQHGIHVAPLMIQKRLI